MRATETVCGVQAARLKHFFVGYFVGLFAHFTHKFLIYHIVDDVLKHLIKLEIMNYDFMKWKNYFFNRGDISGKRIHSHM